MARGNEKANAGTRILPCSCKHAFQDERYGAGNRVHTAGGNDQVPQYTCTVCGKTRTEAPRAVARKDADPAPSKVASGKATKDGKKEGR